LNIMSLSNMHVYPYRAIYIEAEVI
jgi:hypothetical protein